MSTWHNTKIVYSRLFPSTSDLKGIVTNKVYTYYRIKWRDQNNSFNGSRPFRDTLSYRRESWLWEGIELNNNRRMKASRRVRLCFLGRQPISALKTSKYKSRLSRDCAERRIARSSTFLPSDVYPNINNNVMQNIRAIDNHYLNRFTFCTDSSLSLHLFQCSAKWVQPHRRCTLAAQDFRPRPPCGRAVGRPAKGWHCVSSEINYVNYGCIIIQSVIYFAIDHSPPFLLKVSSNCYVYRSFILFCKYPRRPSHGTEICLAWRRQTLTIDSRQHTYANVIIRESY